MIGLGATCGHMFVGHGDRDAGLWSFGAGSLGRSVVFHASCAHKMIFTCLLLETTSARSGKRGVCGFSKETIANESVSKTTERREGGMIFSARFETQPLLGFVGKRGAHLRSDGEAFWPRTVEVRKASGRRTASVAHRTSTQPNAFFRGFSTERDKSSLCSGTFPF